MKTADQLECGTRERISRVLVERGPQTVAQLAEEFGLTAAAVRRHLDALVAAGDVTARLQRPRGPRGRGRPARVWAVTDTGRASSGLQGYDELAVDALTFLRDTAGDSAVAAFAQARADQLETRYAAATGDPEAVAAALTADGYATSVAASPTGTVLCQHHCPVQHAAAAFPELCAAETEALARLLGSHVQRLSTLARGDSACTLHVPAPLVTTEGSRS